MADDDDQTPKGTLLKRIVCYVNRTPPSAVIPISSRRHPITITNTLRDASLVLSNSIGQLSGGWERQR